jgi:hypothetical protein
MKINSNHIIEAENLIHEYVKINYGWDKSVYDISLQSKSSEDDFIFFFVHHEEDIKSGIRGRGKSLLLKFDMNEMRVVQEVPYQ